MQMALIRSWTSLVVFCIATIAIAAAKGAETRPNFVWLISEDNSTHYLKLYNQHGAETPRISALASEGLVFNHAFSNSPVCSVARTTLITSCYGPRIGTQYHRRNVMAPMPEGLKMCPAYLRDAGYYTTNNSKTDYNAIAGKKVWDESSKKATWRGRKPGQPFFHKQSFGASHESSLHFSAQQMKQQTVHDAKNVFVHPYHPDTQTFRYTNARYRDRIQEIDRQIGMVVDNLRADGLIDDTFIFYFGDHGGVLPRGKGYAYETGLHVPLVVRVPKNFRHLVAAKAGTRVDGFVSFVDFGPTLLQLAGIEIPNQIDGQPFLGKDIRLADLNARDEAYGYADRFDEKYDLVRTLRKGKFKYMRNYQPFNFDGLQNNYRYRMLAYQQWRQLYKAGKLNDVQSQFFEQRSPEALYDLEADPYETNNLAEDPRYAKTLMDLRNRLTSWVKGMPDLSMIPESKMVVEAMHNPVAYGQSKQDHIASLVEIADLSLQPFAQAKDGIAKALADDDADRRYWALITCSSHGEDAKAFVPTAKQLAGHDPNGLVRLRAAEFLGLIGAADPRPVIMDALANATSGVEAGLMLNSLTLLRDGEPGYDFEISAHSLPKSIRGNDTVKRRLEYLTRNHK